MSNFFNDLLNNVTKTARENGIENIKDAKIFSLAQVVELMAKARIMEREAIIRQISVPASPKRPEGQTVVHREGVVLKTPVEYGYGDKRAIQKMKESIPHQWNDVDAITLENVENALVVLRNRNKTEVTVRDIVSVIKEFVPSAFQEGRALVCYRHKLTKKFLSSDKKLFGKYSSVFAKGAYTFTI